MASPDIAALRSSIKGDVVTRDNPDYEKSIARWAINSERPALCVAQPKDAADVSAIVNWAVKNNVPLAVCGGGHSPSGASSITDGVVIALGKYLNEVTVDAEKKLAYVDGGALWKTVDEAAIAHRLATVGGTVNHTGVGGLTLGGGYGYLSGAYGLVIDNLVEATIVTADGEITKVSDSENPDLFWGIRGGGGNFGVTTQFVLKLYPQEKQVFAGMAIFPGQMAEAVFKAVYEWWDGKPSSKEGALVFFTSPPPAHQLMAVCFLFYNGTEEEGRRAYKKIFDLGPLMDTCKMVPYEELNALQNAGAGPGNGIYMSGCTQGPRDVPVKVYEHLTKISTDPEINFIAAYEFFPLDKINEVAPDATAFSSRGKEGNILVMSMWQGRSKEVEKRAIEGGKGLRQLIESFNNYNFKAGENTGYANYESEEKPPPSRVERVFKHNYPRMQELKAKYDPNCVFSRWFGVQPA